MEKDNLRYTIAAGVAILFGNNTPHASRQIGAPWGVTFFWGLANAFR